MGPAVQGWYPGLENRTGKGALEGQGLQGRCVTWVDLQEGDLNSSGEGMPTFGLVDPLEPCHAGSLGFPDRVNV